MSPQGEGRKPLVWGVGQRPARFSSPQGTNERKNMNEKTAPKARLKTSEECAAFLRPRVEALVGHASPEAIVEALDVLTAELVSGVPTEPRDSDPPPSRGATDGQRSSASQRSLHLLR